MPRVDGPAQEKSRFYCQVLQSIILAPIWKAVIPITNHVIFYYVKRGNRLDDYRTFRTASTGVLITIRGTDLIIKEMKSKKDIRLKKPESRAVIVE